MRCLGCQKLDVSATFLNFRSSLKFEKSEDLYHEIQCTVNDIYNVKKELEKKISNFISTDIEWIPFNSVQISKERTDDLVNFFETLEEDDDVQNIYSNAKFLK